MLSAHYRSPLNYSREQLEQARAGLSRIYSAFDNLRFLKQNGAQGQMSEAERQSAQEFDGWREKFCAAMDDDLNTADAVAVIFELVRAVTRWPPGLTSQQNTRARRSAS